MARFEKGSTLTVLLIGLIGGVVGYVLHMPLPFMLGALAATALVPRHLPRLVDPGYTFPMGLRSAFVAFIGVAIGTRVTPELVRTAGQYIPSVIGVLVFVPLAHGLAYYSLRRFARFSRVDAYFASAPGGLIDAITLAEEHGADIPRVAMQHFLRIILVISFLPLAISIYVGHPVGSSQTTPLSAPLEGLTVSAIGLAAVVGFVGFWLGKVLRLPARHLTGPLLAAATLSGAGFSWGTVPPGLLALSQIVVGCSLGVRFNTVGLRSLFQAAGHAVLSVGPMLAVGLTVAYVVHALTGASTELLVLTYAPGGLVEMGLVALSISGNPAVVVLHHILRIVVTILTLSTILKLGWRPDQGR